MGTTLPLATITTWLTPIWLLAVGATLGLLVLLACYGLLWVVRRQAARSVPDVLQESVFVPVVYLLLSLAVFAVVAAFQMPWNQLWSSVLRIGAVGPSSTVVTVAAGADRQALALAFRSEELQSFEIAADQDLLLYSDAGPDASPVLTVQGGEPATWQRVFGGTVPFAGQFEQFWVSNESSRPATLQIDLVTGVAYPQVYSIPFTAAVVVIFFLFYFGIRAAAPKVAAIAATTARQAVAQPVFLLSLALGAFLLVMFIYIPYNTFGEDVKMLKDSSLTLIMVLSIFVALWTASVSIAEEVEGRTALTVLCKPVGRAPFVLGKFLGVIWPVLLLFIFLGLLFLMTVSYKVVYDARETANPYPEWQECYLEMIRIVPGLALALMETVVLASISVAISTRLPMLANLVICCSVYVLGHLVPMIVQSSLADKFEIVGFVGRLIATILPVLDHFNIQAAVAAGAQVPLVYLAWALVYCLLYSGVMMLLGLAMFEDRDLA